MQMLTFANVTCSEEKIDLDSAVNSFSQYSLVTTVRCHFHDQNYNYLAARVPAKLVSELEFARRGISSVGHRNQTELNSFKH